jgi:hypothetical protein
MHIGRTPNSDGDGTLWTVGNLANLTSNLIQKIVNINISEAIFMIIFYLQNV